MSPPVIPIGQRFWPKVEKSAGCWEWRGGRAKTGYGQFWRKGKTELAHRIAYELSVGPIPAGLQLDHLCRNHGCVNPSHLEAVLPKVNYLRGVSPLANNARKTHCANGHVLTGENLYLRPTGRGCRVCRRDAGTKYEEAHRDARKGRKRSGKAVQS